MAIIKKFRITTFKKEINKISLKKISLSFNKRQILDDVSFNIREGEIIQELKNLINEEKNISVLVLGANVDEKEKNPGPIINSLVSKELSNFRIPIMIVPGNFSNEHISLIS